MNAAEFNEQVHTLYLKAFQEGICKGEMNPFEAIGVIETNSENFRINIRLAVAKANKPIISPPGGFKLPPNGARG